MSAPDQRVIRRRVRDRNRRFSLLPLAAQRVRVAKDVILQIKDGRLSPFRGIYFKATHPFSSEDLQMELEGQESCTVCAIGAAFACLVKRANLFKARVGYSSVTSTEMRGRLGAIFSVEQLAMIETAFEGILFDQTGILGWEEVGRARGFCGPPSQTSDAERMTKIMENIVQNGGEFAP